ncbi:cytochrome C [Serratia sp. MYb239]|uniref:c-type cytochrome n=1 Tax=Serratia sp. MYb239 TaxID=2033438 RepID=UPI000CF6DD1D|nr:cytochrome c [Serratia sp. MYb239]AVJ17138.1 cytochrome C [Serratia sp. MYb239]
MKSKSKKVLGWGAAVVAIAAVGAGIASWQPSIAPLKETDHQTFSAEQIARGKKLAALGDCAVCHTRPGGERNTGGLAMTIPFGTIYSTNITPDRETGIGSWSYPAFERAMRHGVDRDGHYLYPAFPYTSFTRTSDEDLQALYAWLMSQPPVRYQPPETRLNFPFNIRQGIAAWNWLVLQPGAMQPDPAHDQAWNRGAYLTEGLGHCSACHSPRNILFAEQGGKAHLSGGVAEGWNAPALTAHSNAPISWNYADLLGFMRSGYSANHGVAAGPMGPVVNEGLSQLPEEDLQAMAVYLASFNQPQPGDDETTVKQQLLHREAQAKTLASEGARLYSGACMACHAQSEGAPLAGVRPALALNTNLNDASPDNAIRVVLNGIAAPATPALGTMPAFAGHLSDRQIAVLLNYLRTEQAGKAAWPDLQQRVTALRNAR